MPEINLLQNRVKETGFAWQGQIRAVLVILILALILLVAGGFGLLVLTKQTQSQVSQTEQENSALQSDLSKQQATLGSAQQFQAQLTNLKTLLNQHVYMSTLLTEIEKFTYTQSQFMSMDASNVGVVELEGVVTDYPSLAKLILGLSTSEKFSNVRLTSIAPSSGERNGYSFSLALDVATDVFVKK